ncbi:hypothetical protein H0H92_009626 [Tricholoma furcatifolium]|nr:hypothetical protein H0H92_009626 [Tricholoma furcatifolium]
MEPESEYSLSVTLTFEWTLKGLKDLFESSRGEAKSKPTKSVRFGSDGRWQILFYPNSGTAKEGSSNSDSGGYISLYLSCEPTQEEKDAAAGDGGKAQFARRDNVYFNSNGVKNQDAFVIKCTITSSPAPPSPLPTYRTQPVPRRLLETVGALLDDPSYSDVEFIIPGRGGDIKSARKILASKTLLRRAEYFESMFGSGFSEGSSEKARASVDDQATPSVTDAEATLVMTEFEDSDDEDDDLAGTSTTQVSSESNALSPSAEPEAPTAAAEGSKENSSEDDNEEAEQPRNVRPKLSHPSSPRSNAETLPSDSRYPRSSVVVKDVAYNTYMALLYYLYTDIIVFAPFSSSFLLNSPPPVDTSTDKAQSSTPSEEISQKTGQEETFTTRKQWIQAWKENHPDQPAPCSAKAMYRLADRIDLPELKARASQHIVKSLTVENIAYEVFSPFASAFDDIRKIQVDFFLAHWKDIRVSDSMRNVWQQIRNGRHPGFEEVWPVIASNLEFKPSPKEPAVKPQEVTRDTSR